MIKCGICDLPAEGPHPYWPYSRCRLHTIMARMEEIESLCKSVLKDLQDEINLREESMREEEGSDDASDS
jgi:hypothetical protein